MHQEETDGQTEHPLPIPYPLNFCELLGDKSRHHHGQCSSKVRLCRYTDKMSCTDRVAPYQQSLSPSLIWGLISARICKIGLYWLFSRWLSSKVRICCLVLHSWSECVTWNMWPVVWVQGISQYDMLTFIIYLGTVNNIMCNIMISCDVKQQYIILWRYDDPSI